MKIMEFGLNWVHMARYELISRPDGALWLAIISEPPLTPRRAMERPKSLKIIQNGPTDKGLSLIHI